MAVYKRTYRRYVGGLTPEWSRFSILTRFALEEMYKSRFLTVFFLVSMIFPLLAGFFIYLQHNLSALALIGVDATDPRQIISVDARFFLNFLGIQSMLAFFFAAFTGPGLISPDLAHNGLPLYLARPFSRTEYVLGKICVLWLLFSIMTWIPGFILFGLEWSYQTPEWFASNSHAIGALFLGAWIWILFLSLLSLALSAWVRWKPIAGALLFGVFFVAAGFGAAINAVMRTNWGHLLNISHLIGSVWVSMFQGPESMRRGAGAAFFRVARGEEIPIWACWVALLAICGFCLFLLSKKIRGVEVVR